MTRYAQISVCVILTLLAFPVLAQVAQVYVSTPVAIYAFSAAADGKLTKVPGSPFAGSTDIANPGMVVNGSYLFIIGDDPTPVAGDASYETNVETWRMAADGALTKVGTTNVAVRSSINSYITTLFLDHTGQTLYVGTLNPATVPNYASYLSFTVEKETGELNYTGRIHGSYDISPLTFSGNNRFAFGAGCGAYIIGLSEYERLSDGALIGGPTYAPILKAEPGDFFCPDSIAAADPTGHVAFSYHEYYDWAAAEQLATYKVDNEGNFTTTSNYLNMPKVAVGQVQDMNMSPSGKLLAVGGDYGLQIFHFNGASPITPFTGVLNKDGFYKFFWDSANHLYAIDENTGNLHVYTITPTSAVEAPGSPYVIPGIYFGGGERNLAVQTLPRFKP
jgi:hypothetical protein